MNKVVIVRHAQTEWSVNGRHTGLTDIPLTDKGRTMAAQLSPRLAEHDFAVVLSSPLGRAMDTAQLAGFTPKPTPQLHEWDYGTYEGLTTPEIRVERPTWDLWRDGCPEGESAADVGARVDGVLASLPTEGDALLFAHGHVLRVLTARWLTLAPTEGALFALSPGGIGTLGFERERHVLLGWN